MSRRNLADEVYQLLLPHSITHAECWHALFMESYPQWSTSIPEEKDQCQLINAFWRHQLGMVNENTIKERSFLIDDVCADFCIDNFKKYVLPTVLKLPVPCLK